jgi:hypothetical protein
MNGPRASNPSAAAAAPGKAAAGAGKAVASGAASPSSTYAERNRQEDPVPKDADKPKVAVVLSACQFLSKPPELAIEKEFEVSCKATWSGDQAPENLRMAFNIAMEWTEDGKPKEEDGLEELEAHLDAAKPEQTVTAKGTLPRPPSFPADGTKVAYRVVASHPTAAATSESEPVELVLKERVHFAEVPDILFMHAGHFPCLDEKGWLLDALAASVKFAKEQGDKQQLVVFGHADTSGDHPINYDISERRARAALALATLDDAAWEDLAKQHRKIEEIQRCLKTLSVAHGWACDPGAVDDQDGPKTQGAVKAFQNRCNDKYKLGLTPDGVAGPKTWKAMHRVACGLVAEKLGVTDPGSAAYPKWDKPGLGYPPGKGAYGCGESFPVDRAEVDGLKSEANRRVDFLFGSGWNFLEAPPDRKRPLTKAECPTYDRAVTEWVAIGAEGGEGDGELPVYDPGVAEECDGGCGGEYPGLPDEDFELVAEYEPARSNVRGTLAKRTFEIECDDGAEMCVAGVDVRWILKLDTAISMAAVGSDPSHYPAVEAVDEIQINVSGSEASSLAEGEDVTLEGYLSHGHSPFHHCPIQMALVGTTSSATGAADA